MPFSLEALEYDGRDAFLSPISQLPPLYPPSCLNPDPLDGGEVEEHTLALKQELAIMFRYSGFYLQPSLKKIDIERYSDRRQQHVHSIVYDWTRFPKELQPQQQKLKSNGAMSLPKTKKFKKTVDISQTLENLEKAEENRSDDEKEEEMKDDEGNEPEDELEEEEMEEETDYAFNYFDDGGNYSDEDTSLHDGPTY